MTDYVYLLTMDWQPGYEPMPTMYLTWTSLAYHARKASHLAYATRGTVTLTPSPVNSDRFDVVVSGRRVGYAFKIKLPLALTA